MCCWTCTLQLTLMMGEHWWLIGKETIRWSGHDYLDEGHDDIDADDTRKIYQLLRHSNSFLTLPVNNFGGQYEIAQVIQGSYKDAHWYSEPKVRRLFLKMTL